MTAQELADKTGLSLEEAEMVLLSREAKNKAPMDGRPGLTRVAMAMSVLRNAEVKVGAKPFTRKH